VAFRRPGQRRQPIHEPTHGQSTAATEGGMCQPVRRAVPFPNGAGHRGRPESGREHWQDHAGSSPDSCHLRGGKSPAGGGNLRGAQGRGAERRSRGGASGSGDEAVITHGD